MDCRVFHVRNNLVDVQIISFDFEVELHLQS